MTNRLPRFMPDPSRPALPSPADPGPTTAWGLARGLAGLAVVILVTIPILLLSAVLTVAFVAATVVGAAAVAAVGLPMWAALWAWDRLRHRGAGR